MKRHYCVNDITSMSRSTVRKLHASALSTASSSTRLSAALSAEDWITANGAGNRFAIVPNRSVIEIQGVDSVKYLQGMVSNQMAKVERGGEGMIAAWLNAQVYAAYP